MLFNSLEFALFLPIVFLLYWYVFNKSVRLQNLFIVAVSYLFYGWWDWKFLLLITFTSLCSYGSGLLIARIKVSPALTEEKARHRARLVSIANIAVNLGILGFFKYYNFFADSFAQAFTLLGQPLNHETLKIILPVGISFYTFQALSYSIDVYRGKLEATKDVVSFLAFITFFPQLVAGPIERATHLLPQFLQPRRFDYIEAVKGMRQILWGLFKKIAIADTCAVIANAAFGNPDYYNSGALAVGAICFALQIYGDFSGYSDIAVGCSRLLGIELMQNFNVPYLSRDIAEFWRRWHISLNTWFRDYIYIPLGGSREGRWKMVRNTFVIFLLSGLWHGANWTFVIWGAYHALLFVPLALWDRNRRFTDVVAAGRSWPSGREALQLLSTFALVTFGWIIFRSDSMAQCTDYVLRMFTAGGLIPNMRGMQLLQLLESAVLTVILLAVEWRHRELPASEWFSLKSQPVRWSLYLCLALACVLFFKTDQAFIYFQF